VLQNYLYILHFLAPSHPILDIFSLISSTFIAADGLSPLYPAQYCSPATFSTNKNIQHTKWKPFLKTLHETSAVTARAYKKIHAAPLTPQKISFKRMIRLKDYPSLHIQHFRHSTHLHLFFLGPLQRPKKKTNLLLTIRHKIIP
jgi:hypothetical protein